MAEQWTNDNPGSVDVGVLQSAITDLVTASSAYFDAKRSTETISATLDGWSGEAADAWRVSSADVATELGAHRERLLDAKTAISHYRSTCLDINNRASVHRATISDAMRAISSDPPPPDVDNNDEWQQDYSRWQLKRQQALDDQSYAYAMLVSIADERSEADRTLVSALSTALPPNWSKTAAALADVGVTGADTLWRSSLENAMDELAHRMLEGDPSSADMDALRTLLSMYSDNGPQLSRFFTRLGGEDTLRLVDSLGSAFAGQPNPSENTLPYDLADDLRAALSVASADWDAGTASAFASSMLSEDARYRFDGNAAIAFLFGDPAEAPMGAEFTYQLAVGIDQIERVDGEPFRTPDARFDRGANSLVYFDDPDAYDAAHADMPMTYDPGLVDGTGAVFETLGEYPDRAFEFVGSDGSAQERIEYWFGERDWTSPDGFEGPAALWLGASKVEGGPVSGAYDPEIGRLEALMTGQIIEALAGADGVGSGNPGFLTENLSDAAAMDFGAAITLHLDGISQALQGSEDGQYSSSVGDFLLFTDPVTGETQEINNLSSDAFANLLGQVGGNPAGGMTIKAGVQLISEAIFASAAGDPSTLPAAFEKVVTLQGIADGAGVGSELGVAERSDAELRETIDTVTGGIESLIGFIPIPGSSAVGGTVGLVGGYGIDAWADNWYSADQSYPDAASRAASLEHLGEGGIPGQLASMIYAQCGEALGLTPPPPSQAGSYAYDTWVASTLDDIAVNYGVNSGNLIDGYQQAFSAGSGEARG